MQKNTIEIVKKYFIDEIKVAINELAKIKFENNLMQECSEGRFIEAQFRKNDMMIIISYPCEGCDGRDVGACTIINDVELPI